MALLVHRCVAGAAAAEEALGLFPVWYLREWLQHAMIGRGRAHALEERPSLREGAEQGVIAVDRPGACSRELGDRLPPTARRQAKHGVRTKRGNHPAAPTRPLNRRVMLQRIARRIGRREHVDVEALEERARTELRRREPFGNGVVRPVRVVAIEHLDTKQLVQLVVEPESSRRTTKDVIMLGESPPRIAGTALDGGMIAPRHA